MDAETRPGDVTPSPPSLISPRRLIVTTVVGIALLMGAVGVVGYFFREPLLRVARLFVEHLGGMGVAVGFYIPDAFTIPLPNDAATVLGIAGGMGFMEVVLWAFAGSLAGGVTGYWIGRFLRTTRFVQRVFDKSGGQIQATLTRYGASAVALAAVTPLPYSIFCWAAGAGRVSFRSFFLVSQLRIIRVSFYLYLIQQSLLPSLAPGT
ncbi:MAG: VTT domain-containing protein [Myxococcota bacterium]